MKIDRFKEKIEEIIFKKRINPKNLKKFKDGYEIIGNQYKCF